MADGVVRARGQSVDTVAAKGVDAAGDARPDKVLITHKVARVGSEECACGVVGAIEQVYCVKAWKGTVLWLNLPLLVVVGLYRTEMGDIAVSLSPPHHQKGIQGDRGSQ